MSYIHHQYYSALKNNEIIKILCKLMKIENILLRELTQTQKEKLQNILVKLFFLGANPQM